MKYEFECIEKYVISRIVKKMHSFETNNCSYLAFTGDDRLNRLNNKLKTCNAQT